MQKNSYSYDELIQSGEGKLFEGARNRLPLPPMLMFDRFTSVTKDGGKYGKGQIIAELDIKEDLWFFKCHFQDDPVMPGCLGLDALWQMIGFYMAWLGQKGKGRALGCGNVKFVGEVLPNSEMVRFEVDIKRVKIGKLTLAVGDGTVILGDKTIYKCEDLKVGMFN